jgi:DNA-binding transcriptional LysR family regulator
MTKDQIVCCVPETSPLAAKKSISFQDIAEENIIMLKEGSFLRQAILSRMKDENITPNIVLESNQVVTLKGLVASGVGIAFLLNMVVEDTPGVKAIPLVDPLIVDVGLAWKKDRYISKAAQSFIDFCKDLLKERNAKTKK